MKMNLEQALNWASKSQYAGDSLAFTAECLADDIDDGDSNSCAGGIPAAKTAVVLLRQEVERQDPGHYARKRVTDAETAKRGAAEYAEMVKVAATMPTPTTAKTATVDDFDDGSGYGANTGGW